MCELALLDKSAVLSIGDDIQRSSRGPERDDGRSTRHTFDDHHPETLTDAGEDE